MPGMKGDRGFSGVDCVKGIVGPKGVPGPRGLSGNEVRIEATMVMRKKKFLYVGMSRTWKCGYLRKKRAQMSNPTNSSLIFRSTRLPGTTRTEG